MTYYAALDVSLRTVNICIVDEAASVRCVFYERAHKHGSPHHLTNACSALAPKIGCEKKRDPPARDIPKLIIIKGDLTSMPIKDAGI